MGEFLNRFARKHEIVPVKMWRKDGEEGWLFRDRRNELLFVATSELVEQNLHAVTSEKETVSSEREQGEPGGSGRE